MLRSPLGRAVPLSGTLLAFFGMEAQGHRLALQQDQEKHEHATCATCEALLAQSSKRTLKCICASHTAFAVD